MYTRFHCPTSRAQRVFSVQISHSLLDIDIAKRENLSAIFHGGKIELFSLGVRFRRQCRQNAALRFGDQKTFVLQSSNVRGVRYHRDRSEIAQLARPIHLQRPINSISPRRLIFVSGSLRLHIIIVRRSSFFDQRHLPSEKRTIFIECSPINKSPNETNLPMLLRHILEDVSEVFPLIVSGFIADSFATIRRSSSRNLSAKPSCRNNACCSNVTHFGLASGSVRRHCAKKSTAVELHVGKRFRIAAAADRGKPETSSSFARRSRYTWPLLFIDCLP